MSQRLQPSQSSQSQPDPLPPPLPPRRPPRRLFQRASAHRLRWRLAGLALAWLALAAVLAWGLSRLLGFEPGAAAGPGLAWPDSAWPDSAWWRQQHGLLMAWQAARPLTFLLGFMALFTLLSALSLPGCAPLALLAGTAFGAVGGTLLVGLASTLGATLSFLVARHGLRARVRQHLGHRIQALDTVARRDGPLWLFWLRLVPLVPYPVINPLLGLSRLSLASFFWPSLAGLTLGSVPYVWAGTSLAGLWQGGAPDWWLLAGAAALLAATAALARQRLQRLRRPVDDPPAAAEAQVMKACL